MPKRPAVTPAVVGLFVAIVTSASVALLPSGASWGGTPAPGSAPTPAGSSPPTSSVNSDQAQVTGLQARIAQDGATVEQMVGRYNQAQIRAAALRAEVGAARARVLADRSAESDAMRKLRQIAINLYVSDQNDATALALFQTSDFTSLGALQAYSQIASGTLRGAVDAVTTDQEKTQAAEAVLNTEELQAQSIVQQLATAHQAAQAALAQDEALLSQAQTNLQLVLAAVAQQQAAEKAQEAEMAREAAIAQAAQARPVADTVNPTPGTYANPLRGINALNPERIDQGVDYSGYGPIYAVGDGVVLSTANSGWPGGTFISYRLSDGPAGGLVVYAAEDIDPMVSVGQSVNAGTVLGLVYEGPYGIETGWSDPAGNGDTMARDAGQFSGANSTAFGANFSQMLASLGAPPGVLQNNPPTGTLPANWPTW